MLQFLRKGRAAALRLTRLLRAFNDNASGQLVALQSLSTALPWVARHPSTAASCALLGLSEGADFGGMPPASSMYSFTSGTLALEAPALWAALGLLALLLTAFAVFHTAQPMLRIVALFLTRLVYRIRVRGREHVPRSGGALLVCNHLSYVDPFLVGASCGRPVRFLMYRSFFERPLVGRFARWMGAIPVAAEDGPRETVRALRAAAELAKAGELVCIFAEGQISRGGSLLPFARGLEKIARQAGVPIVPVALDGVYGSIFSFSGGRVLRKWPRSVPYPVRLSFGAPLPSDTPAWLVRDRVQMLAADARRELHGARDTLTGRFLRSAARNARRTAIVDSSGARLTYRRLFQSAWVARRVLLRRLPPGDRVGVYLPPGAGAAVANLAISLAGKVPVNLNYSLGAQALADPIERAGLRAVISSPRFLKALGEDWPAGIEERIEIESIARDARTTDKLGALILSFLPGALLARIVRPVRDPQAVATVLFSSGSTGRPKGVVLTHANLLANLSAFVQALELRGDDRMLGVLPFFHSFGYTVTFWAPLLHGATVVHHVKPTDARTIGELCEREGVTILLATPTFYQAWMRRIEPAALVSVRMAVVGAEKLRPSLSAAWKARFGQELFEGYGCTELSPVVSVNLPRRGGLPGAEEAARAGSVGRPLPGVAVRIVDTQTGEPQPPDTEGRVFVCGANVMAGYLDDPARTQEVLCAGWYDTGDLGLVDADGFLVLTDRASRFSKIGGEMVPHGRVEEELIELAAKLSRDADEGPEVEVAVTAVADDKKGERLVVLHTPLSFAREAWIEALREGGLPALYQPRADQYHEVPAIPRLGSGKTDLKAVRELAGELSGRAKAPAPEA